MDLNQKVNLAKNVLFRELEDEAVLLNLDNEFYYGLDQTGTRILVLLNESNTINTAVETLLTEYDVDRYQLELDVVELINELQKNGLVILDNP